MALIPTPNPTNPSQFTPTFPAGAQAITPSDADNFARPVVVYVGVTGNVSVIPANGNAAVLFTAVPAGTVLPVQVSSVRATGTTATGLVAIY